MGHAASTAETGIIGPCKAGGREFAKLGDCRQVAGFLSAGSGKGLLAKQARGAAADREREVSVTRMLTARGAVQCKGFRVKKALKVADFKIMLEQELQIPVNLQRLWLWVKRQNNTVRPSRCLMPGARIFHSQCFEMRNHLLWIICSRPHVHAPWLRLPEKRQPQQAHTSVLCLLSLMVVCPPLDDFASGTCGTEGVCFHQ